MIEVGDYVRTRNGKIRKVKSTVAQYYITDRLNISDNNQFEKEDIVKHSKNITDLIEVGDVIEVHFPVRNTIRKIYADEYFKDSMILNGIISGNVILKTILTKEQYMQNCYKIDTN